MFDTVSHKHFARENTSLKLVQMFRERWYQELPDVQ